MTPLEYAGREILELRLARKWTRVELAARARISSRLLASIEGESTEKFVLATAKQLAAALDVLLDRVTRPGIEPRPSAAPVSINPGFAGSPRHNHGGDKPSDPRQSRRRRDIRQGPPVDDLELV